MKKSTDLLSKEQVDNLVLDLNPIFVDEVILVGERQKDGVDYQVQIIVTREETDFVYDD